MYPWGIQYYSVWNALQGQTSVQIGNAGQRNKCSLTLPCAKAVLLLCIQSQHDLDLVTVSYLCCGWKHGNMILRSHGICSQEPESNKCWHSAR